jgi:hypothetical protein
MLLTACVRSAPIVPTPLGVDPLDDFIDAPTADLTAISPLSGGATAVLEDATLDPGATHTPILFTPTEPDLGTPTPDASATETNPPEPTATDPPPPTPNTPRFNPDITYGAPRYAAAFLSPPNWQANNGNLPNDSNIRLQIPEEGRMIVTGKNAEFRTWWFSPTSLEAMYTEMTVESGDLCSGKASFGMIIHGPQRNAAPPTGTHGYILMVSCDGNVFMERLDATKEASTGSATYISENIFWWTSSDLLKPGANQINTLGVRVETGEITIYLNGYEFLTVFDETYDNGRLGVFVYNGDLPEFTYTITSWRTWRISE